MYCLFRKPCPYMDMVSNLDPMGTWFLFGVNSPLCFLGIIRITTWIDRFAPSNASKPSPCPSTKPLHGGHLCISPQDRSYLDPCCTTPAFWGAQLVWAVASLQTPNKKIRKKTLLRNLVAVLYRIDWTSSQQL